jgi:AcrR family transcriptional regulator
MARPRLHDGLTATALLDAAEQLLNEHGLEALTVRRVAEAVGTSTRAVYSTHQSKEGLLEALGVRAFDLLGERVRALPVTDDPVRDLICAATAGFREFALSRPALFQVGIQQAWLPHEVSRTMVPAASRALAALHGRLERIDQLGGLGGRTVAEAAIAFHALCEGLAAVELRGFLPPDGAEQVWRDAFSALVTGWKTAGHS